MLAARGVSLGLGKINLSELNQLPVADRALIGRVNRLKKKQQAEPRVIVHKHVDRKTVCNPMGCCCCYSRANSLQVTSGVNSYFIKTYYERNKKTLWQACRFVVAGAILIACGLVMTVLGYFDRQFSTTTTFNGTFGTNTEVVNDWVRYQLKGMQYFGPVLMGLGTFGLILACVLTLESRDRHAQTIHTETSELRKSKREASTKAAASQNDELHRRIRDPEMDAFERVPEASADDECVALADEVPLRFSGSRRDSLERATNRQSVVAEVHEQPGTSAGDIPPRLPLWQLSANTSGSVPDLPLQTFVDRPSIDSGSYVSGPPTHFHEVAVPASARYLSINVLRPRGPAPIAHVDSAFDLPISSGAVSRSSSAASFSH